jgi:hypothetical protein
MAKLEYNQYNERVKQWGGALRKTFEANAAAMGIQHRSNSPSNGSSVKKLKDRYKQTDGAISRISYRVEKALVFTHKGAGRGQGGTVGSKWTDKYGKQKSTSPNSFGKMGTGTRKAKPFINEALEGANGVEALAVIAAEEMGYEIVNKMQVK